ncbi:hypothetical protein GLOIN_2v1481233 [Rhizophagus clarus]|uniref:Uncharacterized protein n=1 Tax=Rhizophagus clarus TaxID=94130 RepID=A0A8H3LU04_9GLOM|nr:hypothetical protein GLOIN_2v1481233 [Rhizophagus clarus]
MKRYILCQDIFSKIHREFWEQPYMKWGGEEWDRFYSKKYLEEGTVQRSHSTYVAELEVLINNLKPGREREKALALRRKLETKRTTGGRTYSLRERNTVDYNENRMSKRMNSPSEKRPVSVLLKEVKKVKQSTKYKRRQQRSNEWTDEEAFDASEDEDQVSLNIFNTPKVEILANFETKSHLERYNIICLFDIEFSYTKKLFTLLSTEQIQRLKDEWIEAEKSILDEKMDKNTFFIDLDELYTAFITQPSNKYQHRSNYELFWCQDLYKRMTLQFLRNRSVLKDKTASEFRYRDELVNHLLSTIFYDVEEAIWVDTGEIENRTRKRQRNFSKTDNEREQLGDKHDGIMYMNVHGSKVEVGFFEVVGNALINDNSFKNEDLIKLLKAMMISLRYQHAYSKDTSNLQSFSILVYGCEFHFLSMHLINNMYVVNEYDAFILPNSSVCFSEIGNVVELRMIMYYHNLLKSPRKTTWLSSIDLPTASPKRQSPSKEFAFV